MAGMFADVIRDLTALVRDEMALARAEIAEKVDRGTAGIMLLVLGALVFFAVLVAVLRVIVLVLAPLMGEAVAGGIVGGIVLLLGLVLIFWGRSALRAEALKPRRTMESLSHKEPTR